LVREGIGALPLEVRQEVEERLRNLKRGEDGRVVCPFLDREAGACLIYEYRPLACRTYGFYVERDKGLYCGEIEAGVERGEYDGVIWGNAERVEARAKGLGEVRGIDEWWGT
jgi:Fe-S-cluster containining protein